jgi:hypothetical protein
MLLTMILTRTEVELRRDEKCYLYVGFIDVFLLKMGSTITYALRLKTCYVLSYLTIILSNIFTKGNLYE